MYNIYYFWGILLLIITWGLTYGFIIFAQKQQKLIDIPNHRSSHTIPTPRGGGLVFSFVFSLFTLCWYQFSNIRLESSENVFLLILPFVVLITFIGFLSDFYEIKSRFRLLAQIMLAFVFLWFLEMNNQIYFIIAWLIIIWSTNLFNFMDGIDGVAAVGGCFVLSGGSALFYLTNQFELSLIAFFMVFCVLGFLLLNWPPGRVFMGDSGSYCLGFLIAILALIGKQKGISLLFWAMLYSAFWFDTSVTLIRRLLNKESLFSAHKKHAYQRLHQAGWSHQRTLVGSVALNSFILFLTFVSYANPYLVPWAFGFLLCFLGAIYYKIECLYPFQKNI